MSISLKYAVVERERRYRLGRLPSGASSVLEISDRYLDNTRLRLREVRAGDGDGDVVRKLGHKVRLTDGPTEVACTTFYLDDNEWALFAAMPGRALRKRRYLFDRDGLRVVVALHADGTLIAEIDDGDEPSDFVPTWLDVLEDVSMSEQWTGARLAH